MLRETSIGSLKKLEWDNLFNYGESNSIDFSNISGIVGSFGKKLFWQVEYY